MRIAQGSPLQYFLAVSGADAKGDEPGGASAEAAELCLSDIIGSQLTIEHTETVRCQACNNHTPKSYAQGYCYRCFKRLARCDLCVMAPQRCHYHKGTCREPEWGEAFCMQPHLVYLANSSSIKVGITRAGQNDTRWADQGALQGRIIARTSTRKAAGELEAKLARTFGDRSQWRALVSGDAEPIDLAAAAEQARALVPDPGPGVEYVTDGETQELRYPVAQWPPLERLNFRKSRVVSGTLVGIKGQYLLFDSGVFNVREHTGYEVTLRTGSAEPVMTERQSDLFTP